MAEPKESIIITNTKVDHITAVLKGSFGAIPFVGAIMAELLGAVIPNQRLDRITRYIEILDQKINHLEEDLLKTKFASPPFIDLFEDSLHQAVRALTDERLYHIASIIKHSLTEEEIDHQQQKYCLRLLGELLDAEIIVLRYYYINARYWRDKTDAFRRRHAEILTIETLFQDSPQEKVDQAAVQNGYRLRLAQLDLLQPAFKRPKPTLAKTKKDELPEFDLKTGMLKASGYQITPLGRYLIRQLDLDADPEP